MLRELLKRGKESLTEKLLKCVDDYEIFQSLIGHDIELGETTNSPIRASDDFPSFALYIPTRLPYEIRPEEIWFKDLADGRYGDVFRFCKYYAEHHFGEILNSRYEIIRFIDRQLELGLFTGAGPTREATVREYDKRPLKDLFYKSRDYTARDLEYWGNHLQDAEDLKFWGVKSIRYLLDDKGVVRKEFRKRDLAFIYQIWDKEKLYQPEAPRSFKFRNTCPGNDYAYYQGYEQLRGKDNGVNTLIITKSFKDVMVFYKIFNEYLNIPVDCIAPHAESINLSDQFVEGVKMNYDRIICVSDFDLAGVKFANQCKRYGFEIKFVDTSRTLINGKFKVIDKDVSDYLINHGLFKTKKLLRLWKLD